jgi:hypothetical protein
MCVYMYTEILQRENSNSRDPKIRKKEHNSVHANVMGLDFVNVSIALQIAVFT